jgi:hypothetical protein
MPRKEIVTIGSAAPNPNLSAATRSEGNLNDPPAAVTPPLGPGTLT